ncbi:hypothetical protein PR048_022004 [Dryococelus australis]|uniref:Uncharacterized protein n=1 Tax=Dryococelus australis TaxID=614101 RepID=A0ABQ9GZT7_9NEOP|nr:hypothetical protein PR048_022004 [Dryococelus australis]
MISSLLTSAVCKTSERNECEWLSQFHRARTYSVSCAASLSQDRRRMRGVFVYERRRRRELVNVLFAEREEGSGLQRATTCASHQRTGLPPLLFQPHHNFPFAVFPLQTRRVNSLSTDAGQRAGVAGVSNIMVQSEVQIARGDVLDSPQHPWSSGSQQSLPVGGDVTALSVPRPCVGREQLPVTGRVSAPTSFVDKFSRRECCILLSRSSSNKWRGVVCSVFVVRPCWYEWRVITPPHIFTPRCNPEERRSDEVIAIQRRDRKLRLTRLHSAVAREIVFLFPELQNLEFPGIASFEKSCYQGFGSLLAETRWLEADSAVKRNRNITEVANAQVDILQGTSEGHCVSLRPYVAVGIVVDRISSSDETVKL